MKKFFLIPGLVLAIGLGGCSWDTSTSVLTGSSVTQAAPEIMANAKKALTSAHIAYNAVGQSIIEVTKTGQLRGDNARAVKKYYDTAGDALVVGDKANDAADAQGILNAVSKANAAIAQAKILVGGN